MSGVDPRIREILEARARELAARGRTSERQTAGEPVAVFRISEELVGLPVTALREVVRVPRVTPVPGLPPWMPGIVQVRGTILSVLDLARWLGAATPCRAPYLVLVELERQPLGLLVESVAGVRQPFADEIVHRAAERDAPGTLPVRYSTRDLVSVLDPRGLYAMADQRCQGLADMVGGRR